MKSVIQIYWQSWKVLSKYRAPIGFLYFINVIATFLATTVFTSYFKQTLNRSVILNDDEGYDISAVLEFFNNYGDALEPYLIHFLIILLTYFIFSIFANASILYAVISQNQFVPIRSFLTGGLTYFWRILRLSIYYLVSLLIAAGLIYFILSSFGINILEVKGEDVLIRRIIVAISCLVICNIIFVIIRQYAKIFIAVKNQPFITSSILASTSFVFKNAAKTFLLYFINTLVLLFIFFIYTRMRDLIPVKSWIFLFFLAQLFIIFKIVVRIVHLDSDFKLFQQLSQRFPDHQF